jgi:phospholipase/carboxylesterase
MQEPLMSTDPRPPWTPQPGAETVETVMARNALARWPATAEPASLLFILFHGVGLSAEAMKPLADRLAAEYPQAAVVSVNAPRPYEGPTSGRAGYQWFSPQGLDEALRQERVAAALPDFTAVVRWLTARFALPWQHTALFGFSQGAIMSLEAVQAEPRLAGRVVAISGRHARAPEHAPEDTTVHLLHGMTDRVVPPGPAIDAAERLVALGGDVTADILPGIGHELHPKLIAKAIEQLRTFIPKKVWRQAMAEAPVLPRQASSTELGGGPRRAACDDGDA